MTIFVGQVPSGNPATAWQAPERTFRRLASADYYLFSVQMWNHCIPYTLKQFIDVVSQPGIAFTFDAEHGYTGPLTRKRLSSSTPRCLRRQTPGGVRLGPPGPVLQRLAGVGPGELIGALRLSTSGHLR